MTAPDDALALDGLEADVWRRIEAGDASRAEMRRTMATAALAGVCALVIGYSSSSLMQPPPQLQAQSGVQLLDRTEVDRGSSFLASS
jgi:hypothetical protein